MRLPTEENKDLILYEEGGSATNFAKRVFEYINQAAPNRFELYGFNMARMPDGESEVRIDISTGGKNCFFINQLEVNPERWFMDMLLVNESLNNSGASRITDVNPYLRYSRGDRKWRRGVSIAAKVVAEGITSFADEVMCIDIHNETINIGYDTKGFKFSLLYSSAVLIPYLVAKHPHFVENVKVMSPDEGGLKRARAYASRIAKITGTSIETAASAKQRDSEGNFKESNLLGNVENANVLLVDDIYASGTTINEAAKQAKDHGAKKVYAHCPHYIGTSGINVGKNLDLLIIGDTTLDIDAGKNETERVKEVLKYKKIEIISYDQLIAEAILRRSFNLGISELLENSHENWFTNQSIPE